MARNFLELSTHKAFGFNGCSSCNAKCCSSSLIFASAYDFNYVAKYFPILFYVHEGSISPVYFFYYGEGEGTKCPYLSDNLCSIYEERPYACRAYPFSFENNKICYDDGCPQIAPLSADGLPLFQKDKIVNPALMQDFVSSDFTIKKDEVHAVTQAFVEFCLKSNLLICLKDFYSNNPLYLNFKPSIVDSLYIVHPQRVAVMRIQNKAMFDGKEHFLQFIITITNSIKNIQILAGKQGLYGNDSFVLTSSTNDNS